MNANDIRKGIVIVFEGDLCKVMEFRHHTPGNLRAMVQAKLRNLRTGNQFEHRFRSNDDIEQAYISQHEMEYMYSDGHAHHFMNTENYEQIEISEDDLGDAAAWLEPGVKLQVQFHDSKPIGVELPKSMKVRIKETQPMVKGATQSSSYKPATLENGVVVQVPPFVTEGEEIIVDPVDNRYLERAR
jgi:elongation factor P